MVEFFGGRGLCVRNTYYEHKDLHKYTRVARSQDGEEIRSMIDLVLVKKNKLLCSERNGTRHLRSPSYTV